MYFGNVFDWNFFWQVFQNFLSSVSPFALIMVAAVTVGVLLAAVIGAIRRAGSS